MAEAARRWDTLALGKARYFMAAAIEKPGDDRMRPWEAGRRQPRALSRLRRPLLDWLGARDAMLQLPDDPSRSR